MVFPNYLLLGHLALLEVSLTPGALVHGGCSPIPMAPSGEQESKYMVRRGQKSACLIEEVYVSLKFHIPALRNTIQNQSSEKEFSVPEGLALPKKHPLGPFKSKANT